MAKRDLSPESARALNRLNALKHAITSNSPVIPGMEDEAAWLRHLDGVLASLAPEGHLEQLLARRIANLTWRFHRVTYYEVAATMRHIDSTATDLGIAANYLSGSEDIVQPDPDLVREHQQGRLFPSDPDLQRVIRYETHLHRQFLQTLHEIEALQARRAGQHPHLARLDISSPPAG